MRVRRLTPLLGQMAEWRMEDLAGRLPSRVMPKGDPMLRTRGVAGPGAAEGDLLPAVPTTWPWILLMGEVDILVWKKQKIGTALVSRDVWKPWE